MGRADFPDHRAAGNNFHTVVESSPSVLTSVEMFFRNGSRNLSSAARRSSKFDRHGFGQIDIHPAAILTAVAIRLSCPRQCRLTHSMNDSLHLLFPLFSSIVFVFGAMFAKQTAVRGTSPFTNTALSNLCLALFWTSLGLARGTSLPWDALGPAVLIAFAFVLGQMCTYLAFQFGDVSLATPIFGVKIIIVAMLSSLLADQGISLQIWIAAVLAAVGIAVIQTGGGASRATPLTTRRIVSTIVLALLAATALSLFDIGLQTYGRKYGAERFLTLMFFCMGLLSCGLLPWANRPDQLRRLGVLRPLLCGALLMAVQAVSISYALGQFGDATRVNIVYSLRGLWSVGLAWILSQLALSPEGGHAPRTMAFRLAGAVLLTISIVVALI